MKGKTYVLSDIHGNFEIFKRMLEKYNLIVMINFIYLEIFVIADLAVRYLFYIQSLIILLYLKAIMNI